MQNMLPRLAAVDRPAVHVEPQRLHVLRQERPAGVMDCEPVPQFTHDALRNNLVVRGQMSLRRVHGTYTVENPYAEQRQNPERTKEQENLEAERPRVGNL